MSTYLPTYRTYVMNESMKHCMTYLTLFFTSHSEDSTPWAVMKPMVRVYVAGPGGNESDWYYTAMDMVRGAEKDGVVPSSQFSGSDIEHLVFPDQGGDGEEKPV